MSNLITRAMMFTFLLLLVGFILLKFETNIADAYQRAMIKQTCKASVETHTALKMRFADFSGDIKCPTEKVAIKNKDENLAKKQIANAMFDCWDQFKRGEGDLFSDDSVYCTVCHRISLDKSIKVNGFTDYLAKTNTPGQKTSYLQFLTPEKTENSDYLNEKAKNNINDAIDASKNSEYAVIFEYVKGKRYLDDFIAKAPHTVGSGTLIGVGFAVIWKSPLVGTAVAAFTGPFAPIVFPYATAITAGVGGILVGTGSIWYVISKYYAGVSFDHISSISLIPYDAQSLRNLNCKEIPIKQ